MGDYSNGSELLIILLVVYCCAGLAWLMWKYLCNECGSSFGSGGYHYNRPHCHHHYDRESGLPEVAALPAGVENALSADGYTYTGLDVGGDSGGGGYGGGDSGGADSGGGDTGGGDSEV